MIGQARETAIEFPADDNYNPSRDPMPSRFVDFCPRSVSTNDAAKDFTTPDCCRRIHENPMTNDPKRCLDAVQGFMTLGMLQDALDELGNLPPEFQGHDVVSAIRIEIYQGLKQWETCRVLAESLAKRSPENPDWWLSWSFSLRREQSVEAARIVLRKAAGIHPNVALIAYNLACYACVLGDIGEAKELLKRAFAMDGRFREMALEDPDLDAVSDSINSGL